VGRIVSQHQRDGQAVEIPSFIKSKRFNHEGTKDTKVTKADQNRDGDFFVIFVPSW
jgi:hypothetical protein